MLVGAAINRPSMWHFHYVPEVQKWGTLLVDANIRMERGGKSSLPA